MWVHAIIGFIPGWLADKKTVTSGKRVVFIGLSDMGDGLAYHFFVIIC